MRPPPLAVQWLRLRPVLRHVRRGLLLTLFLTGAHAQPSPVTFPLTHIPAEGVLLKTNWQFQPGNNPDGASPLLDDRHWATLDPDKDIRELPQLQAGGTGWLRLHLTIGKNLPPLMAYIEQSIASEVYLDGQLLYHFGRFSTNPDRVQAFNPKAAFSLPLRSSAEHLLAIRFACQPGLDYDKKHLSWYAATAQFRLFPASAIPAVPTDTLRAIYFDTLKIGISIILFILHLSLFLAYPAQRTNLYATGLYLLSSITFLARAANSFAHPMRLQMVFYYSSLIDIWVPAMVVLTLYSVFDFRKGWLCWLAIGSIGLKFVPLPADYQWISTLLNFYLPLELIRLSLVASRNRLLGARIVTIGAIFNLGAWLTWSALSALQVSISGHELLYDTLFVVSFLCFPLTLSLRLALEHGWVNRQLRLRLAEVEHLSARNLAQQQERQQLLAEQNERLEQQVAERTREINQQADQLRALDILKSRFVTNITHEFRTPLSLIISPVEKLLRESQFDRPALTLVQRNARRLLRLINQLLDLAKLEGNHMAVSLMQGDITDFIRHSVEGFRRLDEQQDITLTYEVTLPAQAYAFDTDKWETILTNLLSNALTFTPTGGNVTVTATYLWEAKQRVWVQVEVSDTGIGIAPDELPRIFDRFYQADTSSTRAYGGTGIGLALVHELIELQGGTITVESAAGLGTTFRLTMPLHLASTSDGLPKTSWQVPGPTVDQALTGLVLARVGQSPIDRTPTSRLLIVEDNDELREFLVGELTPFYQVLQAPDGEVGWTLAQMELPDMVLTDVMIPRINGYELTRLIKNNPTTDHIAVVMLTAKAAQPSRLDGLQWGADDYLAKPFNVDELRLRLRNLITRQQKLGDYYRQQFALPVALDSGLLKSYAPADSMTGNQNRTDPFLQQIYALLEKHLDDPSVNVDWLATQLAIDRKTLYRKVQSLIQLAPADLIRQYRLRKAVGLLGAGRNVAETADLVGFNTPSHFTIVFKEFYRQTPTEFMAGQTPNS